MKKEEIFAAVFAAVLFAWYRTGWEPLGIIIAVMVLYMAWYGVAAAAVALLLHRRQICGMIRAVRQQAERKQRDRLLRKQREKFKTFELEGEPAWVPSETCSGMEELRMVVAKK